MRERIVVHQQQKKRQKQQTTTIAAATTKFSLFAWLIRSLHPRRSLLAASLAPIRPSYVVTKGCLPARVVGGVCGDATRRDGGENDSHHYTYNNSSIQNYIQRWGVGQQAGQAGWLAGWLAGW